MLNGALSASPLGSMPNQTGIQCLKTTICLVQRHSTCRYRKGRRHQNTEGWYMTHVITSKAALYGAAAENSKLTEIIFEKKIWHREEINLRHGVVRHMSLHKKPSTGATSFRRKPNIVLMLFLPAERGTEETDSTTGDFARVCNLLLKKKINISTR